MSDFGERLKNLRRAAGITQQQLADRLNVHLQTVSKWERGLFEPDYSMLGELAAVLGVPLERLVGGEEFGEVYSGRFSAELSGRALASARRIKGQSQEEVAAAAGVSADIVSKWERGVICPDMAQLCALSSHFAVPASKLYFGVAEEAQAPVVTSVRRRVRISVAAAAALFVLAAAIILAVFLPRTARRQFTVTVDGESYTVSSDEWFSCSAERREGYKFEYFEDSTGSIVSFPVKITADSAFSAVYSPREYTIDYWLNGGLWTSDPTCTFDMESGAVALPKPVKDGAEFMGWYLAADYSGEPVESVECAASDIKLYARWSDAVYTVRYELNGGSLEESNPTSVTAGEEFELSEPLRGGYIFLGWFDSPEGGARYQSVGGDNAKNLTLYARWQQTGEKFTVTYITDGGELLGQNPLSVGAGEVHTLLGAQKTGYDFVGWNTSADGGGEWTDRLCGIADDITLYAIYSPKVYTVVYELNGGAYEGEPNPNNITYGESVALSPLVRGGYTFEGWFTAREGGERIEEITADNILGLTTIYARFTAVEYTVCLDGAGGVFPLGGGTHEYYEYTMRFGETFVLPECTLAGYDFAGWYLGGERIESVDAENIGNITLTAKYREAGRTYSINYVLGGGSFSGYAPVKIACGQSVALPEAERRGWLFLGWNTAADGSGEYIAVTPADRQTDLTLYAVWQEIMVSGSAENFNYEVGQESAVITGYTGVYGKNVDLVIPSYIEGKPVVAVEGRFDRYTEERPEAFCLNSLVIPDTVIRLGENCFNHMIIAEPVVIPASVEEIGAYCFKLTEMSLEFEEGSALGSIGSNAFSDAFIYNIPVLPQGLERLESNAFFGASIVKGGIVLPDTLKYIGGYALAFGCGGYDCGADIYLPEGVEEIEPYAFDLSDNSSCRVYTLLTAEELQKFSDGWDGYAEVILLENKVEGVTLKFGEAEKYLRGSHFALPELYREGCTFLGWRDGEGNFVNPNYIPLKGGVVLEAVFEEKSASDGRSESSPFALEDGEEYRLTAFAGEPLWVVPKAEAGDRIKITFEWSTTSGGASLCFLYGGSASSDDLQEYQSGVSFTYGGGVMRFECARMPLGMSYGITVRMDIV